MTPQPQRRLLLATLTLLATGGLAACGGDSGASDSTSPTRADNDLTDVQEETGVPPECRDAFPVAIGAADLADVELIPAGWPEPPVEATLCQTSSTLDDQIAIASYATEAAPAEVLDAYETALAGTFETSREENGLGEVLSGSSEGGGFEVAAADGSFTLTFSQG